MKQADTNDQSATEADTLPVRTRSGSKTEELTAMMKRRALKGQKIRRAHSSSTTLDRSLAGSQEPGSQII
ncbi:hypothetical protein ACYCVF_30925 [Bradyrhizobium sp. 1.29L]